MMRAAHSPSASPNAKANATSPTSPGDTGASVNLANPFPYSGTESDARHFCMWRNVILEPPKTVADTRRGRRGYYHSLQQQQQQQQQQLSSSAQQASLHASGASSPPQGGAGIHRQSTVEVDTDGRQGNDTAADASSVGGSAAGGSDPGRGGEGGKRPVSSSLGASLMRLYASTTAAFLQAKDEKSRQLKALSEVRKERLAATQAKLQRKAQLQAERDRQRNAMSDWEKKRVERADIPSQKWLQRHVRGFDEQPHINRLKEQSSRQERRTAAQWPVYFTPVVDHSMSLQ